MNKKQILIKNEISLPKLLSDKVYTILEKNVGEDIIGSIYNINSNIKVFKTVIRNNDTPIITVSNGKSFLDKNIYNKNNIPPISFDNGTVFTTNLINNTYDVGLYTINNNMPTPLYNKNGNTKVYGLYYNNGYKTFWSNLSQGIAVSDFSTSDYTQIPHKLNNHKITYTGSNGSVIYTYDGIIKPSANNINLSFNDNIIISFLVSNISGSNNNIIEINKSISNSILDNNKFVNIKLLTQNMSITVVDCDVYITDNNNQICTNSSINSTVFKKNNTYETAILNYLLNGEYSNISNYQNLNIGNNLIYNHYHDNFLKQTSHRVDLFNYYNSNTPIGTIIWYPESWISFDFYKESFENYKHNHNTGNNIEYYSHLVYGYDKDGNFSSSDWVPCDGRNCQNSLYDKIYKSTYVPKLNSTQTYKYRNCYDNGTKLFETSMDHFGKEPNACIIMPQSIRVYATQFTGGGIRYNDCRRICRYYFINNGYMLLTISNRRCCNKFKFRIFKSPSSYDTNIVSAKLKFDISVNGDVDEIYMNNESISPKTQEINLNSINDTYSDYEITYMTRGTTTFKINNFIFNVNGMETNGLRPYPSQLGLQSTIKVEDHYRYGFGDRTKDIISNGFTNFGYFRRLVPLIKIHSKYLQKTPAEPKPIKPSNWVRVYKFNNQITDNQYKELNLNSTQLTGDYIPRCYRPTNRSDLNNNLETLDYAILERKLSELTYSKVTIQNKNGKSGLYYKYEDGNSTYYKHYGNTDVIGAVNNTSTFIQDTLVPFNTTTETIINQGIPYTNYCISAGKIILNENLSKLSFNHRFLNYVVGMIIDTPLQKNNTKSQPSLDGYDNTSGYLYYSCKDNLSGNLPFIYYSDITQQVKLNNVNIPFEDINNCYYNLFGTTNTLYDLSKIKIEFSTINQYTNKSRINLAKVSAIRRESEANACIYNGMWALRLPNSLTELTAAVNDSTNNCYKKFNNLIISALTNNSTTSYKYLYMSISPLAIKDSWNDEWNAGNKPSGCISYNTIKIPPNTTATINISYNYDVTELGFAEFIEQYIKNDAILTTNANTSETIFTKANLLSGYNKRLKYMSNIIANGILQISSNLTQSEKQYNALKEIDGQIFTELNSTNNKYYSIFKNKLLDQKTINISNRFISF